MTDDDADGSLCDLCGDDESETFTCSCGQQCCIECGDSQRRKCGECLDKGDDDEN